MARRSKRLEEHLAGAAGEAAITRGSRRSTKRRGRLVKVIVLGGFVAFAVKPQVRNRVLDALFGPEEQFDYESLTEPVAPGIAPDDGGPAWPAAPAAESDEDDGPSWTFSTQDDWGAAAGAAAAEQEHAEPQPGGEEDEPVEQDGPPTAFGISSAREVEPPAEEEAAPYRYEPPAPDPVDADAVRAGGEQAFGGPVSLAVEGEAYEV